MVSYLPEVENLNGSNADMSSDLAGPSCSSSGDLFSGAFRQVKDPVHFYCFPHY